MHELVEAKKTYNTEDNKKIVQEKEVMRSLTNGNDTNKEDSTSNKVECRKLRGDVGDTEYASEEKKSKHGMLRDNICWTAISDKMQNRAFASCCQKWYGSLTSPMVAEGIWEDVDDYRMLDAFCSLDACYMEDVDWYNLIEHRFRDLCRKRWNQMVRHLCPERDKYFAEQVEILANQYHPGMVDAREAYAGKCPIDLP
ncbi:hypothetical protein REPUB_Repub05bG0151600 [Reevesia pubescens]